MSGFKGSLSPILKLSDDLIKLGLGMKYFDVFFMSSARHHEMYCRHLDFNIQLIIFRLFENCSVSIPDPDFPSKAY